jgi:hypothetical protein
MEEFEAGRTLVNQTISKLLDFENVPMPKKSEHSDLLDVTITTLQHPSYSDIPASTSTKTQLKPCWRPPQNKSLEQEVQTNKNQIFVVVAWILLLLIVWVVIGNKLQLPLGLEVIEKAYGNLFYIFMLILAGSVLSLTTWLYWKNKLTRTANIGVVIVIILSVSLPILTIGSKGANADIGSLSRSLSGFPLSTSPSSYYEPITGIIHSKDKPSAILGGKIIHEGDSHHGVKIVKIHKDKIEFEANGRRWTQQL